MNIVNIKWQLVWRAVDQQNERSVKSPFFYLHRNLSEEHTGYTNPPHTVSGKLPAE
jgi:hypothetical protein